VDEQATEVAWFENATWERHLLATNVPRPLNAACCDINGDGFPKLSWPIGSSPAPSRASATSSCSPTRDVRQPWAGRGIDRVPRRTGSLDGPGGKREEGAAIGADGWEAVPAR